jgi:membrane protease YdiL (CAAX protease family)
MITDCVWYLENQCPSFYQKCLYYDPNLITLISILAATVHCYVIYLSIFTLSFMMSRKKQIQELFAVCFFAYLPAIIYSIYLLITGAVISEDIDNSGQFTFTIIYMVLALTLLHKVLAQRGSTYQDLGISISWKQALGGIALAITAYLIYAIAKGLISNVLPANVQYLLEPKNIGDVTGAFSPLLLILLIINPFCEELIVRGFLMTEVFCLTESKTTAIVASVLFQTSYHLYQGLIPAMLTGTIFLLFSLFYIKTSKLTPVIVAHLVMDLAILAR